jgi:hypothetical protein
VCAEIEREREREIEIHSVVLPLISEEEKTIDIDRDVKRGFFFSFFFTM